jgi:hypothetical protein
MADTVPVLDSVADGAVTDAVPQFVPVAVASSVCMGARSSRALAPPLALSDGDGAVRLAA